MELLEDTPDCQIRRAPGASGRAIVVFSGVGLGLGGIPQAEFRKSLSGLPHECYFVIDKKRCWYNGLEDIILSALNEDIIRRGIEQVATLGNSMGGFGAIVFASRLRNCRTAMAFAPQSSVDQRIVGWEVRWPDYRRTISRWTCPDALPWLHDSIAYNLFFGANDRIDMRHAGRFAEAGQASLKLAVLEGCGHNVASHMKQSGQLRQAIVSALGL